MVELLGMGDGKDVLHIIGSAIGLEQRLFRVVTGSEEMRGVDRNTGDLAQTASDPFGLVVASLAETTRMKRYRHNHIHSGEELIGLKLFGRYARQLTSDFRTLVVFKLMDSVAEGRIMVIEEESGSR